MIYEKSTVCILYKKLLTLYPRNFREQLNESMEQTFRELWNEKQQSKQELFGFVLWTFIETAVGIFREHLLLISTGNIMQSILKTIGSPALISLLLILPFMIMEIVNRREFNNGFPIPLFIILWLLPVLFIITGMPILRNVRAGNRLMARPMSLLFSVVFLILIAMMWGGIVIDQMPCFLGVPNCD